MHDPSGDHLGIEETTSLPSGDHVTHPGPEIAWGRYISR
jgi:hypothetical protein